MGSQAADVKGTEVVLLHAAAAAEGVLVQKVVSPAADVEGAEVVLLDPAAAEGALEQEDGLPGSRYRRRRRCYVLIQQQQRVYLHRKWAPRQQMRAQKVSSSMKSRQMRELSLLSVT